jgi:quinol monooxygenase YgiN
MDTLRVDFSTAMVICSPLASLELAGTHPIDLRPDDADPNRWPHLPRYNDYEAYIKRKAKESLNEWSARVPEMLTSSESSPIFAAAEQWDTILPGVVDRRSFYQHPKLRQVKTGK